MATPPHVQTPTTTADIHAHDERPPHLQSFFVSSEQQFDAAKLGMWLFLLTEILLFSGMFVAYTVFRVWYPESYEVASGALDPFWGGLNTVVLLFSSFTVAMSIHMAQKGRRKKVTLYLVITLLCALAFMVIKGIEYSSKFAHGIYLGEAFDPHHYTLMVEGAEVALADVPYAKQFFSIYFIMTGIHGFHVLVGMGLIGWMISRNMRGHFSREWYTPVELTGLYWHLVDIIWIFLFPLLYLI